MTRKNATNGKQEQQKPRGGRPRFRDMDGGVKATAVKGGLSGISIVKTVDKSTPKL